MANRCLITDEQTVLIEFTELSRCIRAVRWHTLKICACTQVSDERSEQQRTRTYFNELKKKFALCATNFSVCQRMPKFLRTVAYAGPIRYSVKAP